MLEHTIPFLLVLFRLTGLFVFAPALSGTVVPAQARVLMCAILAVGMYPLVPVGAIGGEEARSLDVLSLGWIVAGETLVGLIIGLLAALPMYAAQLGGLIMGQQMGLGLANVYNPALDVEGDTISQLLLWVAITIFIAIGGLESLFMTVASSFASIPAGFAMGVMGAGGASVGADDGVSANFSADALTMLVGVLEAGMDMALRVAAPVLCIILLETVAMAFVMKTLPQLNVMSIGFATKVVLAILALVMAVTAIDGAIHEHVLGTLRATLGAFTSGADAGEGGG